MTTALSIAALPCTAQSNGQCPAAQVPDDDRDAFARRKAEWRPYYKLATREHAEHFETLVLASIRLERCQAQESALRHCERSRALLRWDEERRAQAETLAKGLSRRPSLVACQLRQTRQGAEWMIERWRRLGALLEEQKGAWDAKQTALALDLTGVPRELRGKAPSVPNPAAKVAEEIARLERLKAQSLDAMDALERDAARAGTPLETSAAMEKLRRYEAACQRDYHRAAKALLAQRVTPPAPAPAPATERPRCESGQAGAVRTAPPTSVLHPAPAATPARAPLSANGSQPERPRSR